MIVSVNQPYFAPYPGFFYKAFYSDILVLLDSVQFPRGTTWVSRNRFKNDQGTLWMTVPVWKKGLGLQKINEVKICHEGGWKRKHLQSLKMNYANAPWFHHYIDDVETLFRFPFERLVDVNVEMIRWIMDVLEIKTRLVLLSELGIQESGLQLLTRVCKELGAKSLLSQKSAQKYLHPGLFGADDIELAFFTPPSPVYPQLWGAFVPDLSVWDLLFNCGPKSTEIIVS